MPFEEKVNIDTHDTNNINPTEIDAIIRRHSAIVFCYINAKVAKNVKKNGETKKWFSPIQATNSEKGVVEHQKLSDICTQLIPNISVRKVQQIFCEINHLEYLKWKQNSFLNEQY